MRLRPSSFAFGRILSFAIAGMMFVAPAFATTEKVVYSFAGDGNFPLGELTLVNGLLYGTTDLGGSEFSNGGTVFSVVP